MATPLIRTVVYLSSAQRAWLTKQGRAFTPASSGQALRAVIDAARKAAPR